MQDITLQINVSPGDIQYAHLTVPSLVKKHLDIAKRLLIVDCCRPQRTKLINPDIKFPLEIFEKKVDKIIDVAEELKRDGIITDIYYLKPNDPLIKHLSRKYLRGIYDCTHAGGGTANMSYWAAIELPQTKYILHYDGDILLYQKKGFSWVNEAMLYFNENENIISALPRDAPPASDILDIVPTYHEGVENESYEKYWMNNWFSTRHFMIDKSRFSSHLPLMKGKILVETLLRKYGKRVFPRDPEIILQSRLAAKNLKRLILKSRNAWMLHPVNKPKEYIDLLPQIIKLVDDGFSPFMQNGYADIKLEEWKNYTNLMA